MPNNDIPVSRFEYSKLIVSCYQNGILRICHKPGAVPGPGDWQSVNEYLDALGRARYLAIFQFQHDAATANDLLQSWIDHLHANQHTVARAIVPLGFTGELSGAEFPALQHTDKPTQLFAGVEDAVQWLLSL